jgi:hypothetical protein
MVKKLSKLFSSSYYNGQIVSACQYNIGDRIFYVQKIYVEHIQNSGLVFYYFKNFYLPDLK